MKDGKHITYHNNKNDGKIILVVWNMNLLPADKIFKEKFNKDVTKMPWIGAQVHEV